jgi:hypothetical protein
MMCEWSRTSEVITAASALVIGELARNVILSKIPI